MQGEINRLAKINEVETRKDKTKQNNTLIIQNAI